jgi:indole-3-glycerol phosphate synthase
MTILDEIRAHKETEVATREAARPLPELIAACNDAPPVRGFRDALRSSPPSLTLPRKGGGNWAAAAPEIALIAEVKRRSPAKGDLKLGADAPALAASYCGAGASAVSVLTDERFFSGADADLVAVRGRIPAPVLRKDFTIASYQIYEARALGADAILLIVSLLTDALLETFLATADRLGMDALVEVHSEEEARRAGRIGATIIGINNRDLATFTVDLGTTERIRPLLPASATVVAESGILTRADVERVRAAGAHAALVGEALVTAPDPASKVRELLGRSAPTSTGQTAARDRSPA